ncbi:MAG: phosphatase PAP2 family protein, partial [Clostridiales bacterium]|nr:phosphatase PAP2 family protein [Clostridiales bacterium]
RAITFCGNWQSMLCLCIFIIILPSRMKIGLPVSLITGIGTVIQTIIKDMVERPRPDIANRLVEETSFSFPSGHASASMIFWVALLILVGRALVLQGNPLAASLLRVLFFAFATLIGLSRLYLGVHYPSDVFGGWMLAAMLLIIFFAFYDTAWPSKWRMSYYGPEWGTIPRGAEKKQQWRKPSKKRAPAEQISFPKKSSPWKIPEPPEPESPEE